jgi:hypothetical protein
MGSHTATGEWKSFEIRMRHRRAERLVLRANAAIDEGCLDAARTALDEARLLWAAAPGLDDAERHIRAAANPIPTIPPSRRLTWLEFAAAASVVACIAAAAAMVLTRMPSALHARTIDAIVGAPFVDDPASVHAGSPVLSDVTAAEPSPVDDTQSVLTDAAPDPSERLQPVAVPVSDPVPNEPVHLETVRPEAVRASQPTGAPTHADPAQSDSGRSDPSRSDPVHAEPPHPAPVHLETPVATSGASAPAQPFPELAVTPAPAPPSRPAAVGEPAVSATAAVTSPPPSALVRDALAGYAKAYTDLNVGEAVRVWPSVDRTALARAFDQLDSQRISLGICHLEIAGSTAQATCSGAATWKPKVGSGERTDPRSWTFALEKAADGWQIVSARVQNR